MAVYTGRELVAIINGNTLTHVRSCALTSTIDTVESTAAGGTVKQFQTTTKSWSGSLEVLHDGATDLFDTEIIPGTEGDIDIRPEGTGGGELKISGNCIVTSVDFGIPYDGMVTVSIGVQGDGALTVATQ